MIEKGFALGIVFESEDVAGNREFFHAPSGGLGEVREPDKCARPDMTDKEMSWYCLHWAFDLKYKDKTASGEYIFERPPKSPGD